MKQFILMADVVNSHDKKGKSLMEHFQVLVKWTNTIYGESIKSPLTITLGDEFQGIVNGAREGLEVILGMEEYIIEEEFDFKLRYVLHEGIVETDINTENAYEMLGPGLTKARTLLGDMKKSPHRFLIKIKKGDAVNNMMKITQHFIDSWHPKDRSTVSGFLQGHDYKSLARLQGKNESSLWRRKKSLAIDEYLLCKNMLDHLINE
ncbi:MAG: hypothetical protein Tsb0034_08080 [Ekhidna sp.]